MCMQMQCPSLLQSAGILQQLCRLAGTIGVSAMKGHQTHECLDYPPVCVCVGGEGGGGGGGGGRTSARHQGQVSGCSCSWQVRIHLSRHRLHVKVKDLPGTQLTRQKLNHRLEVPPAVQVQTVCKLGPFLVHL